MMKTALTLWAPLTLAVLAGCTGTATDDADRARAGEAAHTPTLWPEHPSPLRRADAHEAEIDALLARMSLEEKVGQMIQPELRNVTPEDVKQYHLGSILNGGGSFPGGNKSAPVSDWLALAD